MSWYRRTVLVAAIAALAGCSVFPEESEPIEAEATAPASLDGGADEYSETVADTQQINPTVELDLSGDVEVMARREVNATVYRRVYQADDRRVGLLAAPGVNIVDSVDVFQDPVASLSGADGESLALDTEIDIVDEWSDDGSARMLDTEATVSTATLAIDGTDRTASRLRVRSGQDFVTAIATGTTDPPFGSVVHDSE